MVLFKDDWDLYPNAIIDTQTKNTSFLRLAALYRDMGVKNNSIILQLHTPELQGVNPFDPNLSIEQMMMIAYECKINFFYYIREIVMDPKGSDSHPLRFNANRGNMALYWLFFNHIPMILIQPRQTGKSFSVDALHVNLLNLACTKTDINILTKDDTVRASNLARLKDIDAALPFYLRQRTKHDVANTEEMHVSSLGNKLKGHLSSTSPKMALKVGRGLTSPVSQVDELAFINNNEISIPAMLSSGTAARDIAASKGEPYGNIFTTTAGKKDDRDGRYAYGLVSGAAKWSEKFFDARNQDDLESLIRKNSPDKTIIMVNCTFNHRQLGYTDEWLRIKIENSLSKGEDAERDYLNKWTSGSQLSPLPVELSEIIRQSEVDESYVEVVAPHNYIIRWYIPQEQITLRMQEDDIIASLDSSDAAGRDDIALTLRSMTTGETIAVGNYNETNLIMFSEWLCELLVTYPRLTMIIERRSSGAYILDYLLLMLPTKGIDPFRRLYNKIVQEAEEFPDRYKDILRPLNYRSEEVYVKYKKYFGFTTSGTGSNARSELYGNTFINSAKLCGDSVRDNILINQILGLVIKNGRIDHADGEKDDLCVSWLLGFWFMTKGRNLHHYGITNKNILSQNKQNKIENSPQALYERQQTELLRREIDDTVERIKAESDDYVVYKMENKLRQLATKLNKADQEILSLDNLINNLREYRHSQRREVSNYRNNYGGYQGYGGYY